MIEALLIVSMILCWGSLFMVYNDMRKVKFSRKVLNDLETLFQAGIITPTQAMVFLREIKDPLNIVAVNEVRKQLNEIVEKELKKHGLTEETNR